MKERNMVVSATAALVLVAHAVTFGGQIGDRYLDVVKDGRPVTTIVAPDSDAPIWADAIRMQRISSSSSTIPTGTGSTIGPTTSSVSWSLTSPVSSGASTRPASRHLATIPTDGPSNTT